MKLPVNRVKAIPPWAWVALVAVAGTTYLMWHRFANDDDDPRWNDVSQPSQVEPFPGPAATGPSHGLGRPMQTCNGFRQRAGYPGILDVGFGLSVGGEC